MSASVAHNAGGNAITDGSARRLLVTGGAGFIGSALVRALIRETPHEVLALDKLGYAGTLASLRPVAESERFAFERVDLLEAERLEGALTRFRPDAVLHLAAETHVDRSIDGPAAFVESNILGTFNLLQAVRRYWAGLPAAQRDAFRLLHVSTDEVFGSLGPEGRFSETSRYDPRSPYAASKAAADHLVAAFHHTYGLPTLVTNCSNNYGPYQFPEKLIPVLVLSALAGEALPIYGDGGAVRDWLYVEDHVRGLLAVLSRGRPGETYAIGGDTERDTLEMARAVCAALDALEPRGSSYAELIAFVPDRPGHDRRYAIDASKIRRDLGWTPQTPFEDGLRDTVAWYLANLEWCRAALGGERLERLGTGRA